MWSVLHFKEDNTVEVVPDFWFNYESGKCAWPTHNPSRFIEKSHIPSKKYFKYLKARVFNGCEKISNYYIFNIYLLMLIVPIYIFVCNTK